MNIIFNSLPVDAPKRITSSFGPRKTGIPGASTYHKGIDMGRDFSKPQTAILAVKKGTVSSNYWNAYRGWVITINHGDGYTTLYQHLASSSPCKVGTVVKAGQKIGVMGNSSDKKVLKVSVHLHFELRKNGTPINPEPYVNNIHEEVLDMTRDELEKIIDERVAAKLEGKNTSVSNWAKPFWAARTADGTVDGSNPQGVVTREQAATMLSKLIDKGGK